MKRFAPVLLCFMTLSPSAHAQTDDAQELYQRGRDALAHGQSKEAVDFLEKAVALKPQDAGYHHRLGIACKAAGSEAGMLGAIPFAKKMKMELERAIDLDPNLLPARLALLEFHTMAPSMLGGSESAALEQANEIRKRDPIEGHHAFAVLDTAAKKPELARKEYEDLVAAYPASARAHYLFGVHLMLTEKNYKMAGSEFESAVKLDPAYMPAYFQVGHVAALAGESLGRGEESLKKYVAYLPKEDEPSTARAHYWLGTVYEKQGKKDEALSSYEASLKINPRQKDAEAAMKRVPPTGN